MKVTNVSAALVAIAMALGLASAASACCGLGVQGRPHGGNTVVRNFMYRHGLRYHPNRHGRPFRSSHDHPY